jgi:hypothetical protein
MKSYPPNLSPAQVAKHWQCSISLVYRLIQTGLLPAFPLHGLERGALRIPLESLVKYERQQAEKYAEKNGNILRIATD